MATVTSLTPGLEKLRPSDLPRVSVWKFIPKSKQSAIRAGTSTYDYVHERVNEAILELESRGSGNAYGDSGGILELPQGRYPLHGTVNLKEHVSLHGEGMRSTLLERMTDATALLLDGPEYDGTAATLPVTQIDLDNLQIKTKSGEAFTTALVIIRGMALTEWNKIILAGVDQNGPLLELSQVWDSRFNFCHFFEGGTAAGGASVLLKTGEGYFATKENCFHQCHWESYKGKALATQTTAPFYGDSTKGTVLSMSQCKFESNVSVSTHIDLTKLSLVNLSQIVVATKETPNTLPVINMDECLNVRADFNVNVIAGGAAFPKSAIKTVNCAYMDIALQLSGAEPPDIDEMWGIDDDLTNSATKQYSVFGVYPTVNGRYANGKQLQASTVTQAGFSGDTVQYVWAKAGRPSWNAGTPTTPSGVLEDFYFRNGSTNFLTFRAHAADPTSAYRELIPNGHIAAGGAYNSVNQVRLGGYALWFDAAGRLYRGSFAVGAYPSTEASGYFFQTNKSGATGSRPATPVAGEMWWDSTLQMPIWYSGSAWKDAAGNTV